MSPEHTIEDLTRYALIIATIAIVGALIIKLLAGMAASEIITSAVINNSPVGEINHTGYGVDFTLAHNSVNESEFIQIVNDTVSGSNTTHTFDFATYNASWILSPLTGEIQIVDGGSVFPASDVNVDTNGTYNWSYSYQTGSQARTTYNTGISAIDDLLDWLDEVVLVVVAVILITLVLTLQKLIDRRRGNDLG